VKLADGVVRTARPSNLEARRAHEAALVPPAEDPRAAVIVGRRTATDAELAPLRRSAGVMIKKASAAGWTVWPTYARARAVHRLKGPEGTFVPHPGELESIALRMSRLDGAERAVAVWVRRIIPGVDDCKWSFDVAYAWGKDHPISSRSSAELAAYLTELPIDQLIEANSL
jgi:hypothetical protein